MTTHVGIKQKATVFKKRQWKGESCWFVRVACNFLEPRTYGPFAEEKDAERFREAAPSHFRDANGLRLSSIGVGTYLGDADDSTDADYTAAIRRAIALGCNVVDTAINYRCQRSERAIGAAIRQAISGCSI